MTLYGIAEAQEVSKEDSNVNNNIPVLSEERRRLDLNETCDDPSSPLLTIDSSAIKVEVKLEDFEDYEEDFSVGGVGPENEQAGSEVSKEGSKSRTSRTPKPSLSSSSSIRTRSRNKQIKSKSNEDKSVQSKGEEMDGDFSGSSGSDDYHQPLDSMSSNDEDDDDWSLTPDDQKRKKKLTRKRSPEDKGGDENDEVPKKKDLNRKLKKIPCSVNCPYRGCMGLILKSDNALDAHIKEEHKGGYY